MNLQNPLKKWYLKRRKIRGIRRQFQKRKGHKPDLKNPKTFSEKMQWLKIYYDNPKFITCSDKILMKQYLTDKGLGSYLPAILDTGKTFEELAWNLLPDSFVVKANHDSGSVWIIRNKQRCDTELLKTQVNAALSRTFGEKNHQDILLQIEPKVLVEELLDDDDLKDFKIYCFNGKAKFIQVDFDRHTNHTRNFYDLNWNALNFSTAGYPVSSRALDKPENLTAMIELAECISAEFPFLRADLYNVDNTVFIGEMSFFPSAGWGAFSEPDWDEKFGQLLSLPQKNESKSLINRGQA